MAQSARGPLESRGRTETRGRRAGSICIVLSEADQNKGRKRPGLPGECQKLTRDADEFSKSYHIRPADARRPSTSASEVNPRRMHRSPGTEHARRQLSCGRRLNFRRSLSSPPPGAELDGGPPCLRADSLTDHFAVCDGCHGGVLTSPTRLDLLRDDRIVAETPGSIFCVAKKR